MASTALGPPRGPCPTTAGRLRATRPGPRPDHPGAPSPTLVAAAAGSGSVVQSSWPSAQCATGPSRRVSRIGEIPTVRTRCRPTGAATPQPTRAGSRSTNRAPLNAVGDRAGATVPARRSWPTIASPRPLPPPASRDRASSSRTNRSKIRVPVARPARPARRRRPRARPSVVVGAQLDLDRSRACRSAFSSRLRTSRTSSSRLPRTGAADTRDVSTADPCAGAEPGHLLEHHVVEVDRVVRWPRSPGLVVAGEEQQVADQPLHPPARPRAGRAAVRRQSVVGRDGPARPRAGPESTPAGSAARATRRRRSARCRAAGGLEPVEHRVHRAREPGDLVGAGRHRAPAGPALVRRCRPPRRGSPRPVAAPARRRPRCTTPSSASSSGTPDRPARRRRVATVSATDSRLVRDVHRSRDRPARRRARAQTR